MISIDSLFVCNRFYLSLRKLFTREFTHGLDATEMISGREHLVNSFYPALSIDSIGYRSCLHVH